MANELLVGVKIGAVLSGTFQAAFASARGTSLKLGQAADELRVKHARLGEVMARAMSHPTRNVGELRPGVALMPEADAADGQLDVVAASPRHARDVLRMMAGTLVGSRREPGLDRYRGARVEVTTASPVPCHVDGDILGEVTSLTVEVLPAALRVARTVTRER